MAIEALPQFIKDNYQHMEYNHATAILQTDFPNEWQNLLEVLTNFRLLRSDVRKKGGKKSPIAEKLDSDFYSKGWEEKLFQTSTIVDGNIRETPTHKVDCFKNKIAVEIEWNNKDPFYDRDLNNFRLLFDLKAISVGVVITRSTELQKVFNALGKGDSYGPSTTHFNKLVPRILGGGAGGCPVLIFGINRSLYIED
ncbi:BglII/BstYI family type II restriction endonuclease [Pseudomonas juntendi]|uniref:BglII/BstYI family type II restriction endonuclease n=1 Tax=Pseudomonas TaxID=286 RepID=UPI000F5478C9|nr:BglII/BstYI family type II restriction endonuclease [Pseudomonas aeruginosa]RPX43523.1 restriction endonuclease [Pseudomonas aeruginosa]WCV85082.1 restriction endonuclease [Pseudomonas aeruginosa]